jgi:ureidoglycolate hydrolase
MEVAAQELSTSRFAPFGEIVDSPSHEPDASGPGWSWWAERTRLPVNDRPYAVGYLKLEPVPTEFDWAERHLATVEMIVPTCGDCLVHVAPPNPLNQLDRGPRLEEFQAFRMHQGQAIILKPGVWHAAPFAIREDASVLVFLLENTGRDDTRVVRFPETPVTIQL